MRRKGSLLLHESSALPYLLTAYGLPHVMGYLPTRDGFSHPSPLGASGLMTAAHDAGLLGAEFPLPKGEDPVTIRAQAAGLGLHLVIDTMSIVEGDAASFCLALKAASEAGARVVRSTISPVLCGDRRTLPGGWGARMQAVTARLKAVLPCAHDLGLRIALENHQDATSGDLLRLADSVDGDPAYGVTLDTGNPLAVAEDPVEYARKLAPIILHAHLKDYTIHFAPEGYRLVRCAAGDGVVDFVEILKILRANGAGVVPGIEIAAQATRTIPVLDAGWWECYEQAPATQLLGPLQILWKHGRPMSEPYSSAWERGCDSAAVSTEEWAVVRQSIEWFRRISN